MGQCVLTEEFKAYAKPETEEKELNKVENTNDTED